MTSTAMLLKESRRTRRRSLLRPGTSICLCSSGRPADLANLTDADARVSIAYVSDPAYAETINWKGEQFNVRPCRILRGNLC